MPPPLTVVLAPVAAAAAVSAAAASAAELAAARAGSVRDSASKLPASAELLVETAAGEARLAAREGRAVVAAATALLPLVWLAVSSAVAVATRLVLLPSKAESVERL